MTDWNSCLEWREKRRYDRITTDIEVQVRNRTLEFANRDLDPGEGLRTHITELSFAGSRLTGDRLLGLRGHCLELNILAPEQEYLSLLGHVVRVSQAEEGGYEIGLRFFRVSVQDQLRLTHILHTLDRTLRLKSRPLSPFSRAKKKTITTKNHL